MTRQRLSRLNLRRAGGPLWGVGDQAISSAGNVLLTITAARSGTSSAFGAFSVVLATHFILLTSSRALVSMPLMMGYGKDPDRDSKSSTGSASLSLMLGLASAFILAGVGLLIGGYIGYGFICYAVICPVLLLQDSMRFVLNVSIGARATTVNDGLWTFVQILVFVPGFFGAWSGSPFIYMLLWGGAAGIAAVLACLKMRLVPSLSAGLLFARDNISVGPALLVEGLAASGSAQIAIYVLVVVGGLSVVGHIQAALVLFGPVNILFMGVLFVAVPTAVRMARRGSRALMHSCLAAGTCLAVVALTSTVAIMLVPAEWGQALLGPSWVGPSLVLPIGLSVAVNAFTLGAMVGFRAVGVARQTMVWRLLALPLPTLGAVCGYVTFATVGAAYGMAISNIVFAIFIWNRLRHHLKSVVVDGSYSASEAKPQG
jgi:O-antigen/teichoic acid export membrane protein